MILIGDAHAKFKALRKILNNPKFIGKDFIQVGDLGVGFVGFKDPESFPECFYFYRGNHDSPAKCRAYPNYMGEFGFHPKFPGVFFCGGGYSIDQHLRTPGIDWWEDEELSVPELNQMIGLYEKTKPNIFLSHEAPDRIGSILLNSMIIGGAERYQGSRTAQALEACMEIHEPELFIFGHWHVSKTIRYGKTKFICLNELETLEISI